MSFSPWAGSKNYLFSLSHHFMVWLAAELASPNRMKPIRAYAILGDDYVIADAAVAREYVNLMTADGVKISKPKSLVSDSGALEFAKQFWKRGKNLSPVSLRALLVQRTPLGISALCHTYDITFNVYMRLAGAGYRVRAQCRNKKYKRWRRILALYSKFGVYGNNLDYWLGGGKPLDPYVRGRIVDFFRPESTDNRKTHRGRTCGGRVLSASCP